MSSSSHSAGRSDSAQVRSQLVTALELDLIGPTQRVACQQPITFFQTQRAPQWRWDHSFATGYGTELAERHAFPFVPLSG